MRAQHDLRRGSVDGARAGSLAGVRFLLKDPGASLAGHDVLLVPTLLIAPPAYRLLDQPGGTTRVSFDVDFATTGWAALSNVTGWAAVSLPLGVTGGGLPVGVQLMALAEAILLKWAVQREDALPWAGDRPPGWVGAG